MKYSVLNNYLYENKLSLLKNCDWLSHPLRVALNGKTVECPSGRELQDNRIKAIALCCLVIPVLAGTICLLLKHISHEAAFIRSLPDRTDGVYKKSSPSGHSTLFPSQPFVNAHHPLPIAQPSLQNPPVSEEFVKNFIDHLFEEFHEEQSTKIIEISADADRELYVKQGLIRHTLKQVIESINWGNLDARWNDLDQEKTQFYIQKSVLFSRLRDPLYDSNSPFNRKCPFIRLYTSYGFYSIVNPLIRNGKLRDGQLFFASEETNNMLGQHVPDIVCKIAKEVLFVSLMMAGSLCNLSDQYLEKGRAIRTAHVPQSVLEMMNEGQVISERGFMSASAGGGYAGGGPCDSVSFRVKYVITSKNGKQVSEFSDLKENEILFRPFSQFKICKRIGDPISGFIIEMEEI